MTYYKATRVDGTDFRTGTVDYGAALVSGKPVRHPGSRRPVRDLPSTYLSISATPTGTMVGGSWPCRLFEVEPIGATVSGLVAHRDKRAVTSMRVTREIDSWRVFGPHGRDVAAIIERASRLSGVEIEALNAARDAAWDAAWGAALDAAGYAARDAAWYAARNVARDAARDAAWDAAGYAAWGAAGGAAWNAARGAAWYAARDAAWGAAGYAAWDAARDAAGCVAGYVASAYLVKDLISDKHFNALCGPWRSVIKDM